ncbi:hypothetical protein ACFYNX_26250 [Streptomyces sp. NPDC007872]
MIPAPGVGTALGGALAPARRGRAALTILFTAKRHRAPTATR